MYIDDEILSTIALKVESNIRELEGTLNKIVALAHLTNQPVSMEVAAKAVKDITGADAYLVCKIRENSVQRDWSPETICYVTREEYTEERNGPDGYKKYNESSHEKRFVVEGQYVYLHLLNLEYCLYNTFGQKIMLMNNQLQEYGTSEKDQFEDLLKEFAKELQKAKKNVGK